MARTTLSPITGILTNPTAGVTVTFTAADIVNDNDFVLTGKELILVQNADAAPQTVTITSAPDALGRTKDIAAESIAAGAFKCFGVPQIEGWRQSDGKLYLEASDADVKFCILRLP